VVVQAWRAHREEIGGIRKTRGSSLRDKAYFSIKIFSSAGSNHSIALLSTQLRLQRKAFFNAMLPYNNALTQKCERRILLKGLKSENHLVNKYNLSRHRGAVVSHANE
jgi:hypothetical protein